MKLSTWHNNLKNWINSKVLVHSWELHEPLDPGKTHCFLPPIRDVSIYTSESGEKMATATQEIWFTTMYTKALKYHQLPINVVEGAYVNFILELLNKYLDIADIFDLDILTNEQPIRVEEYGDDLADWLIRTVFYIQIKWIPELETITEPQYPLIDFSLGLYRTYIPSDDFTDKILDARINLNA